MDRWKLDPIQCEILADIVLAIQVALQDMSVGHDHADKAHEVHAELDKNMQYFKAQCKKKMGSEITYLQREEARQNQIGDDD